MTSLPGTLLSPAQILSKGIEICVNSFARLFMLTTFIGLLMLLPSIYLAMHIGNAPVTPKQIGDFQDATWYVIQVLCMVVIVLFQGILIVRLDDIVRNGVADFRSEFQHGLRALPPLIVGSLIMAGALIAGYFLLVVPGVLLTVSLAFFQYCVVLDRQGALAALNRSHTLVWGNWWRTFWVMILMILVLLTISIVVLIPFAMLLGVHPGAFTGRDVLVEGVLEMIAGAMFTPFIFATMYVQFNDLKLRHAHLQSA